MEGFLMNKKEKLERIDINRNNKSHKGTIKRIQKKVKEPIMRRILIESHEKEFK
jgi:hypothetical protein